MPRVSLKMKWHTGEFWKVKCSRPWLAVLERMIPYCSFSIAKWEFIACSPIPFVVPNDQQEFNNKFVLASNLDSLIIEYVPHKNPLMKLRSCLFNHLNHLFSQIGNMLRVLKLLNPWHLCWSATLNVNHQVLTRYAGDSHYHYCSLLQYPLW